MSRLIFIVILVIVVFSCSSESKEKINVLNKVLEDIEVEHDALESDILFIVPNAGCSGCISSAEYFVKENIFRTSKLGVIFTGTNLQKALRLKIGDEIYNHSRVFIDKDDVFYNDVLMSLYPVVVYKKGNRIVEVEFVSPDNLHVLDRLTSKLYK